MEETDRKHLHRQMSVNVGVHQRGCFLYYEGETMRDYCDRNGEPYPVREIPEEIIKMFESGDFSNLKKLQRKVPELKDMKP